MEWIQIFNLPNTWLTIGQRLWMQIIGAICLEYIFIATNNVYICDLKQSLRLTAKHRWDKRDSMYLGVEG